MMNDKERMPIRLYAPKRTDTKNVPRVYTMSEPKSSETRFNKSAVKNHITKPNHVIDWEGAKVVDRENNQRLRQVKEAIRISQF